MKHTLSSTVRFGVFELDLRAGELRREGRKTKLQDQPFRVLSLLLENPGEMVTREELRSRIWPADTFVDFDQGLNKAILKVREALDDDASNPRFVETLPRKGYRFICPVTPSIARPGNGNVLSEPETVSVAPPTLSAQEGLASPTPIRVQELRKRKVIFAAAIFAIVAVAALMSYLMRPIAAPPTVTKVTQLTDDGRDKGFLMATDGASIYFSELIGGRWQPVVVSAAGGDPRPVPMPPKQAHVLDVSPDGTEMLIADTVGGLPGPLASLPVLGGSPRPIGDIHASEARWSPDGRQILYLRDTPGGYEGSHDLYLANSDGTGSRKLVTAPGSPYLIRWSPDGGRISFSVDDGKSNTLWEVSADGSNLHPVLPGWNFSGASCSGYWTPDGRYLLFDSFRGGTDNIWAIREKGRIFERVSREPVRLTTGPVDMGRPVTSRDGKKIFTFGTLPRGELLVSVPKSPKFSPFLGGISAEYLDFSRDGKWIAYVTYPDHTLWKCKADGSERTQLTFSSMQVFLPHWSPDGRRIVFDQFPPYTGGIFVISAEGGNPEKLPLDAHGGWISDADWSPDGKSVIFGYMDPSRSPSYIQIYNLETRSVSKVPGSDGIYSPRWSPNGDYILGETSDTEKLMLFNVRNQKWTVLASPKGGVGWPLWSQGDGKHAFFTNGIARDPTLYRVDLASRRIQPFVNWDGSVLPSDPYGYVGMGPNDSVFVLKSAAGTEIYALDLETP